MKVTDITQIPLDDQEVWDLICEGHTKGIFQFESRLGKAWCRRVKPRSIEELAALASIIRPGCLRAVSKLDGEEAGKTMTERFCDRKHGVEQVTSLHPSIDHIVESTYGIIVFQEQSMRIAQVMAGFSEQDADVLRKAIGKKKADLMQEVRGMFIKGCEKQGHAKEDAEAIFDIIEKSNRYSFNKSHAVCYAMMGYWSAYLKCHDNRLFYLYWLRKAKEKPDTDVEVRELIMSARTDQIKVYGPRMEHPESIFSLQEDGIYFGLSNIKSVGIRESEKLRTLLNEEQTDDYVSLLLKVLNKVNKRAAENMVAAGVFTSTGVSRNQISHDLSCIRELSPKEVEWLENHFDPTENLAANFGKLAKTRKEGGGCHNAKRVEIVQDLITRIQNPGRDLRDTPGVCSDYEERLLGMPVTYARMDGCADAAMANMTCKEFVDGRDSGIVACEISACREHTTKKEDVMAFLTVEDETAEMENVVIFPQQYEEFGDILYDKATVLLYGKRSDRGSFIVEKVAQI